jgi:iron complex outermembrane receptor protein
MNKPRINPFWGLAFTAALIPSAVATAAKAAEVEEVIVTAQRRAEKLENVPMSVSVVSAEIMTKSGVVGVHDLGQVTSGVVMAMNGTNTQPAIRGVSFTVAGSFGENNIAVYVDGLYQGDAIALNQDFANIADVQVLKGPQGTLYGRNATGGAILINTKEPSHTFTGNIEVGYAMFNEKTFSGYVTGPITDRLRYSLAAYNRSGDGYIKYSDPATGLGSNRSAAPSRQQNIQAKVQADLSDDLTATLGYTYNLGDDGKGLFFTPVANAAPTVPAVPNRPVDPFTFKAANAPPRTIDFGHEGNFKLVWQTGIGTLTSTSGYSNRRLKGVFDTDGTYVNNVLLNYRVRQHTFQSNLNYQITAIDRLDLVVGGSFYDDYRFTHRNITYLSGVAATYVPFDATRRAWQFYADGTYHVTDALSLNIGGGYATEYSASTYASQTAAQLAAGIFGVGPVSNHTRFKKFSPRASLRYELAPQTSVYASYAEGFKAGAWQNSLPPTQFPPVQQESIRAYEVGFKMARSSFRFEAAGFYYDYKDIQTSGNIVDPLCTLVPATLCSQRVVILNGPKSEIYGLDSNVTVSPVDHLNVRAGAAWVHARYKSFPTAIGTGLNTATGFNVNGQVQDWSNLQMPKAPTISGNLGVDYDIVGNWGDLLLGANASFTSSYAVSNPSTFGPLAGAQSRTQRYRQGGYTLVNLQATWTDPSSRFSLGVFVRNLTDKRYWINLQGNASGDYGTYAPPRVFGGRAKVNF